MNVTSHRQPDGRVEIVVAGELDMATAPHLEKAVSAAVADEGTRAVLVDLAGVPFCDSSGIAVLDRGYGAASDLDIRFRVAHVQPMVRQVLEIVGLMRTLTGP